MVTLLPFCYIDDAVKLTFFEGRGKMSFRFQRRVKVAPGVRLNFSKRGVSTSIGVRGASITVGKRGIYGNVGIPGSGLSYRTRLDSKGKNKAISNSNERGKVIVEWDDAKKDFIFSTDDGRLLTIEEEKQVRRAYKDTLIEMYKEKAKEINEETKKLLQLHHQIFPKHSDLISIASDSVPLHLSEKPNIDDIYKEIYSTRKERWTFIEKLNHVLPKNKQRFEQEVKEEATKIYEEELAKYREEVTQLNEEREHRIALAKRVETGDISAMESWLELFLDELDFPLETNVEFQIISRDEAYVDMDLPEPENVPEKKAEILKSGKLKMKEKTQREQREHYAMLVGGSAFYLASFFFHYLPTLTHVYISGYNQIIDTSTGHEKDQYIYSLKIDKETLYSFKMENIHPIDAFQHFEPKLNVTKTYIFKEISPYAPPVQ